ncbi:hypothetical protein CWR48_17745 [Oceanobacillus arenosus]|uniref:Uncharacterized protein n=1 Tax=Oceanobacillus arenosus TaxID=1229153 RepID=A0A3D8PLB8_9BACI|nr:hypothetical protein [Oceanobacillus arenosus]RDW16031.1 hypothetical protein CWR48_17745 [Oceanobacillus arenosus]
MFKSEIANRITSLVGFWIIVFIALFKLVDGPISPMFWILVVGMTAFDLYGIINYYMKKNRDDSLN